MAGQAGYPAFQICPDVREDLRTQIPSSGGRTGSFPYCNQTYELTDSNAMVSTTDFKLMTLTPESILSASPYGS